MRLRSRISTWWRAVSRAGELNRQISEELEFHIESYAEDLVRGGLPRDEAMRQARAELGSVAARKEDCRSAWGAGFFDELRGWLVSVSREIGARAGGHKVRLRQSGQRNEEDWNGGFHPG